MAQRAQFRLRTNFVVASRMHWHFIHANEGKLIETELQVELEGRNWFFDTTFWLSCRQVELAMLV